MTRTLVDNIGLLVTNEPSVDGSPLGLIQDAALLMEDGAISWIGESPLAPRNEIPNRIDAQGRCVIPGFVDSHTHLIFAGDRSDEFRARMQGEPYTAGGINYTVELTRKASNGQLLQSGRRLIAEANTSGTTTIECKSGYGLTVDDEARSLVVAKQLTDETTFLGAHIVPMEYRDNPEEYVDLVCGPMLDAARPNAKWIDVFCDKGAFTAEQTRRILKAGIARGLLPRLHANQLEPGEGVQIGVALGAASVDHVSHLSDDDISLLANSQTLATLLPAAEFSTRSSYPDARRLFEAGVNVALASDCNPGSSYTTNIPFVIAVAVRDLHFSPEQAIWSATKGGAMALRRKDVGHLGVGASADFSILSTTSYIHLAYRPGVPLIDEVWRNGRRIK
ncbi:MAG: imidazolonepropionase [Candidatus Nanopelagicaceae bacterium]|nr:imidazolonepropionase [Candidatus Nanopelagicaceae bacterium]